MDPEQEIVAASAAVKAEQTDITKNLDTQYADMFKREQEAIQARQSGEATLEYEKIRKHGFVTKADVQEDIKGIFGKFVSELEAMRQENTQLREWVMRAKAQGLNSGATEGAPSEPSAVDAYLSKFGKGRR